jgi:hypothetical protein
MSMSDIERIAAQFNDNQPMEAFRRDVIRAFHQAMGQGVPLQHCCDIAVGIVMGAMVQAVGVDRARAHALPALVGSMHTLVELMASPEAQGNA